VVDALELHRQLPAGDLAGGGGKTGHAGDHGRCVRVKGKGPANAPREGKFPFPDAPL
jgi:hypothetical protein